MNTILRNIFLLMLFTSCNSSSLKNIPVDSHINISIDGMFSSNEWEESRTIHLTENNILYLMQNEDYLYLGIRNNENLGRYVDLYINNEAIGTINLHASMQLGERQLSNIAKDTFTAWNWGNKNDWTANTVKVITEDEQIEFLESVEVYQGFEFKIDKDKIQGKRSKIRIEIQDFMGKEDAVVFPANSERLETETWFTLELD